MKGKKSRDGLDWVGSGIKGEKDDDFGIFVRTIGMTAGTVFYHI